MRKVAAGETDVADLDDDNDYDEGLQALQAKVESGLLNEDAEMKVKDAHGGAAATQASAVSKKQSSQIKLGKQNKSRKKMWDVVICDEAHRLKNAAAKRSQLVQKVKARQKILLTGTPIQNKLRELHTLMTIATTNSRQKILGDFDYFQRNFGKPIY